MDIALKVKMLKAFKALSEDELKIMKLLLVGDLDKDVLKQVDTPISLFEELGHVGKLTTGNQDFLNALFAGIDRKDLLVGKCLHRR